MYLCVRSINWIDAKLSINFCYQTKRSLRLSFALNEWEKHSFFGKSPIQWFKISHETVESNTTDDIDNDFGSEFAIL